ncbi:YciI family protein [Candidatus Synechococcus calcipolaris G9]|uniref:YciI family protein n=1 Tax=Candidatus Synechococcus calcipolaris G9 TaxID=1497997 RepID=A0ABT6F2Y6_9SYNE|nr:YciI family protein [Candidatus Synechococcus calcipolaris]MDG2992165.1 YciI family protein [Candidatus Synechococcus calcipolaris G9]
MPWFVKIERGVVDKPVFDRYVAAHRAYVRQLIDQGHRAKTGYWGELGGGMMIFEADSQAIAQIIIAEDPLIKNHCVDYELHEWKIVEE